MLLPRTVGFATDTPALSPPPKLPARFLARGRLGKGGFGEVWRAWDQQLGREVAVKLVRLGPDEHRRFRREVAAMRRLALPGLVRLLDFNAGEKEGWLSMEVVEGGAFPGAEAPAPWPWLAPRLAALLAALGPLHAAGFVHRDLKPNNVLVDEAGVVTVLDLGLAAGPAAGSTITESGTVLGTPRYMAPEQCRGARADARADLYAVGVMAYEALTGEVPHEREGVRSLLRARAFFPAPPVASKAPGLPWHVAAAIDALLAFDPARRPPTAEAALRLLGGAGQRAGPLPFLGDSAAVEADAARLREGRGLVVAGPAGSGRSRWVAEVAGALDRQGWEVTALPGGQRPFESLAAVLGPGEPAALEAGLAELSARHLVLVADGVEGLDRWSRRLVEAALDRAPLLLTHTAPLPGAEVRSLGPLPSAAVQPLFAGPERLFHLPSDAAALLLRRTGGLPAAVSAEVEAWVTRGLAAWEADTLRVDRADLERIEAGAVAPAAARPGAPAEPALEELLHWVVRAGPAVPTDGLARARGEPTWALSLQLEALAESGAVRLDGAGWRALRPPAEELEPDLSQALHGALADLWPAGSPERQVHLVAAGRLAEAAAEAGAAAEALVTRGRPAAAVALLEELVNAGGGGAVPAGAVPAGAVPAGSGSAAGGGAAPPVAVSAGGGSGLGGRPRRGSESTARERMADTVPLARVAPALAAAAWSDRGAALQRRVSLLAERLGLDEPTAKVLDAAPGAARGPGPAELPPAADPELEVYRRDLLVAEAARGRPEAWAAAVAEHAAWAEATGEPDILARARGWRAELAYTQSRWAEAAQLAEEAARLATRTADVFAQLYRAASVYLEIPDAPKARELATELVERAAGCRLPLNEARGTAVLRTLAEREGTAKGPDLALVAAAGALGDAGLSGVLLLTEARITWKLGRAAEALPMAVRAAEVYTAGGRRLGALCAEALRLACGEPGERERRAASALAEAEALGRPDVWLEVVGLLATANLLPPGDWPARVEATATKLPGFDRDWPHGAFSVEGVLRAVRSARLDEHGTGGLL